MSDPNVSEAAAATIKAWNELPDLAPVVMTKQAVEELVSAISTVAAISLDATTAAAAASSGNQEGVDESIASLTKNVAKVQAALKMIKASLMTKMALPDAR